MAIPIWPVADGSRPKNRTHRAVCRNEAFVLIDCHQETEQMTAVDVFGMEISSRESSMPYTRPNRRFYLTPPAVPTFVISVLFAVLAVLAVYGHIPQLHSIGGFTLLLIGYVVLMLGTLLRGI